MNKLLFSSLFLLLLLLFLLAFFTEILFIRISKNEGNKTIVKETMEITCIFPIERIGGSSPTLFLNNNSTIQGVKQPYSNHSTHIFLIKEEEDY
jgi:hypothetical protein